MGENEKTKDVMFRSIFISYLVACAIILGMTGFGYINYYRMFKENTETFARQQAEIVTSQVAKNFVKIQQVLNTLEQHTTISEYMNYSDTQFIWDSKGVQDFQSDLSLSLTPDECADIYAYFYKSHSILGARMRRYNSQMLPIFLYDMDLEEEEFLRILDFPGANGIHTFDDGKVWIMRAVFDKRLSRNAVIIVEVLLEDTLGLDESYADNLVLLTAGDQLLYSNQDIDGEDFQTILKRPQEQGRIKINGELYYLMTKEITSMQWQCIIGIPDNVLYKGLRVFWVVLVAEMVGAVMLMLLMSWRLAHRTYRPVEQLMEILGNASDGRFQGTYDSLVDSLKKLTEENHWMKRRAQTTHQYEKRIQAARIVRGDITDEQIVNGIMENFAGVGRDDLWAMALIRIPEDPAGVFKYDQYVKVQTDQMDLKYFVLLNVLNEMIFEEIPGNAVQIEDNYMICVRLQDESQLAVLEQKLQELMDFYKTALNVSILVMLGGCESDIMQTRMIYQELYEEMSNNYFWIDETSKGKVWKLEKSAIEQSSTAAGDYLDANRRLINALDAGDYSESAKILEYIFSKTFSRDRRYLEYNVYRMYGLISTVSMALNLHASPQDKEFLKKLNYEERMFSAKTVEQLMTESREILTSLILYESDRKKNDSPNWLPPVLEYIRENLADINLSVAEIADHFEISVPHLSRTFKNWMGCGMLEYIHKLRVEESKKYLAEGDSINDAAVKVGYLDSKGLTRAFKRYEGITPGQYKENQMKTKDTGDE